MSTLDTIERSLVGAMVSVPAIIPEVLAQLEPEDFNHFPAILVYRSIKELHQSGNIIDLNILNYHLSKCDQYREIGGRDALEDMCHAGDRVKDVDAYISVIRNASRLRRLSLLGQQITQMAKTPATPADDILAEIHRRLEELHVNISNKNKIYIPDYIEKFIEELSHQDQAGRNAAVTGYQDVDKILGGIYPGDLVIIAGRPGTGKTSFLIGQMAHLARRGWRCAFFSLEMRHSQIVARLCTALGPIQLSNLIAGRLLPSEYAALQQVVGAVQQMSIWLVDQTPMTVSKIRSVCMEIQYQHGLDIVFVDYLQLIDPEKKTRAENRQQVVSEISRGLKMLATSLGIPLIVGSQLSRNVEHRVDRKPVLADLRDSGSIEQDADIVAFLYRGQDDPQNLTRIAIAKHRNGPTGDAAIAFIPERATFVNVQKVSL